MKNLFMTIILAISLLGNLIFVYDRLEKKVYQQGIRVGVERLNNKIVEEVLKNKRLNIKLPKGQSVVMVPQQQQIKKPENSNVNN